MTDAFKTPRKTADLRTTQRAKLVAALWTGPRFFLRLFAMAGGLAVRTIMLHDGRWPSIASGAGLGLLAVGLMSCTASEARGEDWYRRCGPTETIRTGWLTETDYQKVAADQRARGCYPVAIKGDLAPGAPARLYRATFKPHPDNVIDWRAAIGTPAAEDAKLDAAWTAKGYVRIWQDDITDTSGAHYVQSVWTKVD